MPIWLPLEVVIAYHDTALALDGGLPGIKDQNGLEAALDRARNKAEYGGETDIAVLAAAYAYGLGATQTFNDGNKRTAFIATAAFLRRNGYRFQPNPAEGERLMYMLAQGEITEASFAVWIRGWMRLLDRGRPGRHRPRKPRPAPWV